MDVFMDLFTYPLPSSSAVSLVSLLVGRTQPGELMEMGNRCLFSKGIGQDEHAEAAKSLVVHIENTSGLFWRPGQRPLHIEISY